MSIISRNNVGTAVLLLFVVIISQARVFDVLVHTALGRILLIAFILFLSYANKILGVVGVLFIIIMFNSSGLNMMEYEGLENNDQMKAARESKMSSTSDGTHSEAVAEAAAADSNGSVAKEKLKEIGTILKQKKEAAAAEGFDVLGVENSIRRGKQSNSIPTRRENNLDNDVFAYDGSSIFGNFSPF
jgi:hypothetical protein